MGQVVCQAGSNLWVILAECMLLLGRGRTLLQQAASQARAHPCEGGGQGDGRRGRGRRGERGKQERERAWGQGSTLLVKRSLVSRLGQKLLIGQKEVSR